MNHTFTELFMSHLVQPLSAMLLPAMLIAFVFGIALRCLVYYTVRSEYRLAKEFEKRAINYLVDPRAERVPNFYKITRILLEKTYFECFELKRRYKRRNIDHVTTVTDRLFLIQEGAHRLVKDTMKQARYMRKDGPAPRFLDLTKSIFDMNPVFTRVLALVPVNLCSELLAILPGLFVIGGIFGTFLGISAGLPALSGMDLANMDVTKAIMDTFLGNIAHAMIASTLGIFLSVVMTVFNTIFAADGIYFNLVNTYAGTLETLWNETTTNQADRDDFGSEETRGRGDRSRPKPPTHVSGKTAANPLVAKQTEEEATRTLAKAVESEEATRAMAVPPKPGSKPGSAA